jgi:hypothetical protein
MRLPHTALLALAILGGAPAVSLAQDAAVQELIQLERDWDAAFFRNDTAFIDRVLAAEFLATYPDGSRGDRAKELANAASFNLQIDSSTRTSSPFKCTGRQLSCGSGAGWSDPARGSGWRSRIVTWTCSCAATDGGSVLPRKA